MCPPEGLLLPDADPVCGRAHDHVLQVRKLRKSVERELRVAHLVSLFVFVALMASAEAVSETFKLSVFMCVWKRPTLTRFVLQHYNSLKPSLLADHSIHLDMFITGSDNSSTAEMAEAFGAAFAVHPNRPVGRKHNLGLRSLREHYMRTAGAGGMPDAVAIVGSDDLLNTKFFVKTKELMARRAGRMHIIGLRDVYFFDLHSLRLMYTPGYRHFVTPVSGTVGCGRVFSWAMLDTLEWDLWDWERDRSLDQSTVRRILSLVPQVAHVSAGITGLDHGIAAVDVKTDAFEQGTNIWGFDAVVKAVGQDGPLHEFQEKPARSELDAAFGTGFFKEKILKLRMQMRPL